MCIPHTAFLHISFPHVGLARVCSGTHTYTHTNSESKLTLQKYSTRPIQHHPRTLFPLLPICLDLFPCDVCVLQPPTLAKEGAGFSFRNSVHLSIFSPLSFSIVSFSSSNNSLPVVFLVLLRRQQVSLCFLYVCRIDGGWIDFIGLALFIYLFFLAYPSFPPQLTRRQ